MTRVLDFDSFRAEQKRENVVLKINGKDFPVPAALPATIALDILRMQEERGPKAKPTPDDLMRIGSGLFGGHDVFATILAEGAVTLDELPDFMKFVLDAYTEATAPEPDPTTPAEQPAPSAS